MSDNAGFDDEVVSSFISVTGIADTNQATSYLEMSGGNLEMAVSLYMEHNSGGHPDPPAGGGRSSSRNHSSSGGNMGGMGGVGVGGMLGDFAASAMMGEDGIRAADQTITDTLIPTGGPHPAYSFLPPMFEEQQAHSAFASIPTGFDARDMVNEAAGLAGAGKKSDDDGKDDDDDDDKETSNRDKENGYVYDDDDDEDEDEDVEILGSSAPLAPARLSDMFAPPTHLMHKAGGFQGARTVAKDSKRWLLVNLQRDSEFSCHALNRDVWRDELVINLVRTGFIFWQTMDITPEGRTYAERYGVHDYPHLAIIDPRTGRLMWRKEGWTQENPVTTEVFAQIAMDFCDRNTFDRPPSAPAPRPPSTSTTNGGTKRPMHEMSEDEQLRAAMQASLAENTGGGDSANNNKDSDNDDAKMEVDDDDDDVEILEKEDSKQSATGTATSEAAAAPPSPEKKEPSFIDELIAMNVGEEPGTGARMQFRMPDGKRSVRKFLPSDSVKVIYAHVAQSNDEARGGREFSLRAGFPPRDLFGNINETIENCKLAGESITVMWK